MAGPRQNYFARNADFNRSVGITEDTPVYRSMQEAQQARQAQPQQQQVQPTPAPADRGISIPTPFGAIPVNPIAEELAYLGKANIGRLATAAARVIEEAPRQVAAFGDFLASGAQAQAQAERLAAAPLTGQRVDVTPPPRTHLAEDYVRQQVQPAWQQAVTPATGRMRRFGEETLREAGPGYQPNVTDIPLPTGAGDVPRYGLQFLKSGFESVGESALPTVAGTVISAAGAPQVGIPLMAGSNYALTYGGIREQQLQQGVDDVGAATLGAGASASLDLLGGVGGRVAQIGTGTARGVAAQGVRAAAKGVLKTSGEEALTEGAQTLIERAAGYQSVTDRAALKDVIESMLVGGMGGAGFSTTQSLMAGVANKYNARQQAAKDAAAAEGNAAEVARREQQAATVAAAAEAAGRPTENGVVKEMLPSETTRAEYMVNVPNVLDAVRSSAGTSGHFRSVVDKLTKAFETNDDSALSRILAGQTERLDPDIHSPDMIAERTPFAEAVAQLINGYRADHQSALQLDDEVTNSPELARTRANLRIAEQNHKASANAAEAGARLRDLLRARTEFAQAQRDASQMAEQQAQLAAQQERQGAEQAAAQAAAEQAATQEQAFGATEATRAAAQRNDILQSVVTNPGVENPTIGDLTRVFRERLGLVGQPQKVGSTELKALNAGLFQATQPTAAAEAALAPRPVRLTRREATEASNLGMTPEQYSSTKAAASERGLSVIDFVTAEQQAQQPVQPLSGAAPRRPTAPPPLQLEAQAELTPADLAKMEKAQAKRQRKADRQTAAAARQAAEDRNQMSFLTEAAPVPAEGKTGIKQRFDVGKKAVAAREAAEAEARAAAKVEKPAPAKRPVLPKDKRAAETAPKAKPAAKKPAKPEAKAKPAAKVAERVKAAEPKTTTEQKNAAEKGKKPQGRVAERVGADAQRAAPEAGRGNRPVERGPVAEEAKEEVTYETVAKKAQDARKRGDITEAQAIRVANMVKLQSKPAAEIDGNVDKAIEANVKASEAAVAEAAAEVPTKAAPKALPKARRTLTSPPRKPGFVAKLLGWPARQAAKRQIEIARKTGSARALLTELAKQRGEVGDIASTLLAVTNDDVKVKVINREEMARLFPARPAVTAATDGIFNPADDTMYLPEDMADYTTPIHEFGHALMVYELESDTDLALELHQIFDRYGTLARDQGITERTIYGIKNVDEFLSEIFASSKFRAQMAALIDGKGPKGQKSLWDRFIAFAQKVYNKALGRTYSDASSEAQAQALKDIVRVFEIAAIVGGDRLGAYAGQDIEARASIKVTDQSIEDAMTPQGRKAFAAHRAKAESAVTKALNGLPDSVADPLRVVADALAGTSARAVAAIGVPNQVLDMAAHLGIKSAVKFKRVLKSQRRVAERYMLNLHQWAESESKLPSQYRGTGKGTVSGFIESMTRQGKWGFEPDYFTGADTNTEIELDPKLKAEFDAMPKAVQDFIKQGFEIPYTMVKASQRAVMEQVETEYDTLIDNATDDVELAKLNAAKKTMLKKFRGLLSLDPTTPYAPLQRSGKYVVVGKSDHYLKVEEEAAKSGDPTELNKLQADGNHYFVDFAANMFSAAKLKREISAHYGTGVDNAYSFKRSEAQNELNGGRDMMSAFSRLNNLVSDLSDAKLSNELSKLVTDLQLTAMAATSARKNEIARRNVKSSDLDMVRNIADYGRSMAHFISRLNYGSEVADTLKEMKAEAEARGPGRMERSIIFDKVIANYVDDMRVQPETPWVDTLLGTNAFMTLLTNPGYYIQNLSQNPMITQAYLGGRFGDVKAGVELGKAATVVMKAWDKRNPLQPFDLDLLPAKYRAMLQYIAENELLDVGVNVEVGDINTTRNPIMRGLNKFRAASRATEFFNRSVAAIASFELELEAQRKGGTSKAKYDADAYADYVDDFKRAGFKFAPLTADQFEAAFNTADTIENTHFDYSRQNTPTWLRGRVGRVAGQFRKFQLYSAGMLVKEAYRGFAGDATLTTAERKASRRAISFMVGHSLLAAGLRGLPFWTAIAAIYGLAAGDEGDSEELERDIRKTMIEHGTNPALADVVIRGTPTVAGVDMSGSVGFGTTFSLLPYTEIPADRSGYEKALVAATGPFVGGTLPRWFDAGKFLYAGEPGRAVETAAPSGVRSAVRAVREAQGGVTNRKGLVTDDNVSGVETMWGLIGLRPVSRSLRESEQAGQYAVRDVIKDRVSEAKQMYIDGDTAGATKAWRELNDYIREHEDEGFKVKPISSLYKARQERRREQEKLDRGEV